MFYIQPRDIGLNTGVVHKGLSGESNTRRKKSEGFSPLFVKKHLYWTDFSVRDLDLRSHTCNSVLLGQKKSDFHSSPLRGDVRVVHN